MAILYAERFDWYTSRDQPFDLNNQGGLDWTVVRNNVFEDWIFAAQTDGPWGEPALRHAWNGRIGVPFGPINGGNTKSIWAGHVYYQGGASNSGNAGVTRREVLLSLETAAALNAGYHWALALGAGANELTVFNAAGGVVARAYGFIQPKTWHWVEVEVDCANSGTFKMWVDGVAVFNVSGDFLNGSDVNNSYMHWRGMDSSVFYHNVIVADGSGSSFNARFGAIHMELQSPDADGAVTSWTASTGSRYQCIDDAFNAGASDGDYISSSVTDDVNLASHAAFTLRDLDTIKFVQVVALARSDTTGDELALAARSGGVDAATSDQLLYNGAYKYRKGFFETDPNTSAAWTLTNLNNAEFGVKKRV
jgi:hypothetical protein